jgi:hypothetical protein
MTIAFFTGSPDLDWTTWPLIAPRPGGAAAGVWNEYSGKVAAIEKLMAGITRINASR